jgi:hypothetical protein
MSQSILQWTKTKPTLPGWFWYREPDIGPIVVMIDWTGFIEDPKCRQLDIEIPEENTDLPMFEDATGEWAGPLSLPVESISSDLSEP